MSNLLTADHQTFIGIFDKLIDSTTVLEEEDEEKLRPKFKSVTREIRCLKTLVRYLIGKKIVGLKNSRLNF